MLITWPQISILTHFSELGHYLKNLLTTLNNNKMNNLLNKLNTMQSQHIKELEKRIEKLLKQLNEIKKDNIKELKE